MHYAPRWVQQAAGLALLFAILAIVVKMVLGG